MGASVLLGQHCTRGWMVVSGVWRAVSGRVQHARCYLGLFNSDNSQQSVVEPGLWSMDGPPL